MSCTYLSILWVVHDSNYSVCSKHCLYITLCSLVTKLRKQGLKFTCYNFQGGSGHFQFISVTKEQIVLPFFNPSANILLNIISALPAVSLIPNSSCVAVSLAGVKSQPPPQLPRSCCPLASALLMLAPLALPATSMV